MDDKQIIELYWGRSEEAVKQTTIKYGTYCHFIAYNILRNHEDSEECVNDTYLHAWNSIPPHRPDCLMTYLGKITRNLSLNKYKQHSAQKRGGGQIPIVLEELHGCIPTSHFVEQAMDQLFFVEAMNCFLKSLDVEHRMIFMRRYWYISSIKEIAQDYGFSESKIKMILSRTRKKLKRYLEKEGFEI